MRRARAGGPLGGGGMLTPAVAGTASGSEKQATTKSIWATNATTKPTSTMLRIAPIK